MTDTPPGTTRSVVMGVFDLDDACRIGPEALGFPLSFRDGSRRAQFTGADVIIAVAGNDEAPAGSIGLSITCANLDSAVTTLVQHGCPTLRPPADGPHGRHASDATPFGPCLHLDTSRPDHQIRKQSSTQDHKGCPK
jgi:hypothetical protein